MEEQRPWHRLFGLSWTDFFRGMPVTVEMEKDLSLKKQLLDVLVIRTEVFPLPCRLPDGFEELSRHNLISFKSHKEKLSVWALQELLGHYVNYRKQASPSMDEDELLAEDEFRLFAVTARFPQQLASALGAALREIRDGVYEVEALSRSIRIVVLNQLPQEEHNAMLHLFSTRAELLVYGARHYHIRSGETSTLLEELFKRCQEEGLIMPDALEEFAREAINRILKELPVEKRLEGLSPEELVKGLSAEQREALRHLLEENGDSTNPPGATQ